MTNGEIIQEIFKGCDVCEPIIEDNIIHVIFVDKNDSAIGFDWDWWNMEYKEPTPSITLDELKELLAEVRALEQGTQDDGYIMEAESIIQKKISELEDADGTKEN